MCLGRVPHFMGRGRAQTARTGGGSEQLLSASANTWRFPSCAFGLCSAEVAADLEGKLFPEEHFLLDCDSKRDPSVKVGASLICAALFDHKCFHERKCLKIWRDVNRKWMGSVLRQLPRKRCIAAVLFFRKGKNLCITSISSAGVSEGDN